MNELVRVKLFFLNGKEAFVLVAICEWRKKSYVSYFKIFLNILPFIVYTCLPWNIWWSDDIVCDINTDAWLKNIYVCSIR